METLADAEPVAETDADALWDCDAEDEDEAIEVTLAELVTEVVVEAEIR